MSSNENMNSSFVQPSVQNLTSSSQRSLASSSSNSRKNSRNSIPGKFSTTSKILPNDFMCPPQIESEEKRVSEQIYKIVQEQHPSLVGLSNLNRFYEKRFGEKPLFKTVFGSKKISDVIRDIPTLDTKMIDSECYAFVKSPSFVSEQTKRPPPLNMESISSSKVDLGIISRTIAETEKLPFMNEARNTRIKDKNSGHFVKKNMIEAAFSNSELKYSEKKASSSDLDGKKWRTLEELIRDISVEDLAKITEQIQQTPRHKNVIPMSNEIMRKKQIEKSYRSQNFDVQGNSIEHMSTITTDDSYSNDISSHDHKSMSSINDVVNFFKPKWHKNKLESVCERSQLPYLKEGALLGHFIPSQLKVQGIKESNDNEIFINTHQPFFLLATGIQGTGKSHFLSCIIENCLIPFPFGKIITLQRPMTALILHYDRNEDAICEAKGLYNPDRNIDQYLKRLQMSLLTTMYDDITPYIPGDRAVILVSPTFHAQRKTSYGPGYNIVPLLFRWDTLTIHQIKRIICINFDQSHSIHTSLTKLFRQYQRIGAIPDFQQFHEDVNTLCNFEQQRDLFEQNVCLLQSIVAESDVNKDIRDQSMDIAKACQSGKYCVIADLTDPLFTKQQVNGLFCVLMEQFRSLNTNGGKLLAIDEAHKFIDKDMSNDFNNTVVDIARHMRRDNVRIAMCSQNPSLVCSELLELVTITALFHFHSLDWWSYLKNKLPFDDENWKQIVSLKSGEALLFASRHDLGVQCVERSQILPVRIRSRITTKD